MKSSFAITGPPDHDDGSAAKHQRPIGDNGSDPEDAKMLVHIRRFGLSRKKIRSGQLIGATPSL